MINDELLSIHHVPGKYVTADLLPKPLSPSRIWELWAYTGLDTSKVEMPGRTRARTNVEVAPLVRVIMVSLLVTPVQAQGPEDSWTYQAFGAKVMLRLGALIGLLTLA